MRSITGSLIPILVSLTATIILCQAAAIEKEETTTVGWVPINFQHLERGESEEETTTIGWVPIKYGEDEAERVVETTLDDTTTGASIVMSTTTSPIPEPTPTRGFTTTSFKDAEIQYRPLHAKLDDNNDIREDEVTTDEPMAVVDIESPDNHTHIVTWLDPTKVMQRSHSVPRGRRRVSVYNIKMSPLFPVVQERGIEAGNDENEEEVVVQYFDVTKSRTKRGVEASYHDWSSYHFCGGTFQGLSGILKSPGYPLYYPNKKTCVYDVTVPANHTIKLTCDDFGLQGRLNSKCQHDFITIEEPNMDSNLSTNEAPRFCGEGSPIYSTKGHKLLLTFTSDGLFRYRGFKCRFRAIQPNGIAAINSFDDSSDNDGIVDVGDGGSGNQGTNYDEGFFRDPSHHQCVTMNSGPGLDVSANPNDPDYMGTNLFGGLWSGSCGTANSVSRTLTSNRIVGGMETVEHQFPWMVSILRVCGPEYCHTCGGTIISPSWILTSAHCISSVSIENMAVLLGDHDLYSLSYEQKFMLVKEAVIHPDFNDPTVLNNDIGLLRLEHDVSFTKFISPLCLPPMGETGFGTSAYGSGENTTTLDTAGLDIVGRNATVIGWGMTNDDGLYPNGLHEVTVQVLNNSVCSNLFGPMITETMMCTSGDSSRGSCYGDSGGPALVLDEDGSWVQVGIVSFGANGGCEKGYPSGQVLVHKFIDWIQYVTGLQI